MKSAVVLIGYQHTPSHPLQQLWPITTRLKKISFFPDCYKFSDIG
jgi:hypothetical protein